MCWRKGSELENPRVHTFSIYMYFSAKSNGKSPVGKPVLDPSNIRDFHILAEWYPVDL